MIEELQDLKNAGYIKEESPTTPPAPENTSGSTEPIATETVPPPVAPANGGEQPATKGISEVLRAKFGENYDSIDKVYEDFSSLRSREEQLAKENEILAERVKKTADFADPEIAEFNGFVKETGIKNYSVFSKLKNLQPDKVKDDPIQVLVTRELLDNPEYASKESVIRSVILSELGFEDDEDYRANLSEEQSFRLQSKARKALAEIETYRSKIKPPEVVDYEAEVAAKKAALAETEEKLRPIIEKVVPSLQKFSFAAQQGSEPYEFDFSEDLVKKAVSVLLKQQASAKDPYSAETLAQNVQALKNEMLNHERQNFLTSFANHIRQMDEEAFRKRFTKPSAAEATYGESNVVTPDETKEAYSRIEKNINQDF